jgi:hypothetical protein
MKKTRIVGRIVAGAVASALLVVGALGAPAQAKGGDSGPSDRTVKQMKDTGWGSV